MAKRTLTRKSFIIFEVSIIILLAVFSTIWRYAGGGRMVNTVITFVIFAIIFAGNFFIPKKTGQ